MKSPRFVVVAALSGMPLLAGLACDLEVADGQVVVVDDSTSRTGQAAMLNPPEDPPQPNPSRARPGASVLPGGSLIVDGGRLFGGAGIAIARGPSGNGAAGVEVQDGSVQVIDGLVHGGDLFLERLPPQAPLPFGVPGAGIQALRSAVSISGGTIVGGVLRSAEGIEQQAGAAINVREGDLKISGGTFRFVVPSSGELSRPILDVASSTVEITDGVFPGFSVLFFSSSRVRIAGGDFALSTLSFRTPLFLGLARSCAEIHKLENPGELQLGPLDTVFVVGRNFSLPLGDVAGDTRSRALVQGQFADGSPLFLRFLLTPPAPSTPGSGSRLVLVEPGQQGCPARAASVVDRQNRGA